MAVESPKVPVVRRLAAILAADVAGYSRLMGADEEGTLKRLKGHRCTLVDLKIAEHHGRIVKSTGARPVLRKTEPQGQARRKQQSSRPFLAIDSHH